MADGDDWTTNSNDAITVSLVAPTEAGIIRIASFHPRFTYPIFGDQEQILGYDKLKINLNYHASDMRPNLIVQHGSKSPAIGETEPTDIQGALKDFLPEVAFQKKKEFETAIKGMRQDWAPPGENVATWDAADGSYHVFKASLESPIVKQIVKRIQILVTFFIEGGRFINEDDADADRWTIFFLYQKKQLPGGKSLWVFAGYCTVYKFFYLQASESSSAAKDGSVTNSLQDLDLNGEFDLSHLPCRTRISQFIITPPFQRKGLGDKLYDAIFQGYLKDPQTKEITVEDPNEAFDDLRDVADLRLLRASPDFLALRINKDITVPKEGNVPPNIVDKASSEAVRKKYKIAPRQFARVLEMHLMSKLPDSVRPGLDLEKGSAKAPKGDEYVYRLWTLLVKQRIYRQNKDTLGQLAISDRITKLEETVSSVEFDYARILNMAEARNSKNGEASSHAKRKLEDENGEASASKKARIEESEE